jgi:hypothetical protein
MPGRLVYKLGTHTLKVKAVNAQGQETSTYITLPILSRCLEKTGELLKLDKATEEDIKVTRQVQRRGGSGQGGQGGSGSGGQGGQGNQGGGGQQGQSGSEEIVYYRLGSWRADRIILVYTESGQSGQGGQGGSGGGGQGGQGNQGGSGNQNQGSGNQNQGGNQGQQQQQKKRKTLQIPIPSWAPNYKVLPVLFSKAQEAGLEVVGAYRHGYLIPSPSQLGRDREGGGVGNNG